MRQHKSRSGFSSAPYFFAACSMLYPGLGSLGSLSTRANRSSRLPTAMSMVSPNIRYLATQQPGSNNVSFASRAQHRKHRKHRHRPFERVRDDLRVASADVQDDGVVHLREHATHFDVWASSNSPRLVRRSAEATRARTADAVIDRDNRLLPQLREHTNDLQPENT